MTEYGRRSTGQRAFISRRPPPDGTASSGGCGLNLNLIMRSC